MATNRGVVLVRRPFGRPEPRDFAIRSLPMPRLEPGEMVVMNLYCSLDPAMRRWMDDDSYAGSMPLGQPLRCTTIARVEETDNDSFAVGDHILVMAAMEDFSVVRPDSFVFRIEPDDDIPLYRFLNLFGLIGMTAYFGLLAVGSPKVGETVLISAAAGAVGSIVGQIAKIRGCRVVGIAGGEHKCQQLVAEYGFDDAIDYRDKNLEQMISAISMNCPAGVDIYFDNVGGLILDAALACINTFARLVECGMISQYNDSDGGYRLSNIWQMIAKSATMKGFLGRHYFDRFPEALSQLKVWAHEGKIVVHEHVASGLENFYPEFIRLFDGSNEGKLVLKV